MDFSQYGLSPRVVAITPLLLSVSLLHESMLTRAVLEHENVFARLAIETGRDELFILPALNWHLSGISDVRRNVLFLAASPELARSAARSARRLSGTLDLTIVDLTIADLTHADQAELTPGTAVGACSGVAAEAVSGLAGLAGRYPLLVVSTLPVFLDSVKDGSIDPGSFGMLVVDGLELVAEKQADRIPELRSLLPPSWELKALFVCTRFTTRARMLARDLAENPSELVIDETSLRMRGIANETFHIDGDSKIGFLLGLAKRGMPGSALVFCNLSDTAAVLVRKLAANGLSSDHLSETSDRARSGILVAKALARTAYFLVVTDEGSRNVPAGSFSTLINFDIPLDPDVYMRRAAFLNVRKPGSRIVNLACERYVFGLSAIESLLGFSLEATEVPESLVERTGAPAAVATIAGSRGPMSDNRDATPARGSRNGASFRPSSGSASGSSPGSGRDSRSPRQGSAPEAGPGIMLSIEEASGRMTSRQVREGVQEPVIANAIPARKAGREVSASRPSQSLRSLVRPATGLRGKTAPTIHPEASRPLSAVQSRLPKPDSRKPDIDPYSLTMEERLSVYRDKYAVPTKDRLAVAPGFSVIARRQISRKTVPKDTPQPAGNRPPAPDNSLPVRVMPVQPMPGPDAVVKSGHDEPPKDQIVQGRDKNRGFLGKIADYFRKDHDLH